MGEAVSSTESEKYVPTVGVILIDGDKVLAVRHGIDSRQKLGIYGLPSGRIEEGETAKEAAVRQLREETGLETDLNHLIEFPGNYFKAPVEMRDRTENNEWTVFLCTKYTGELRPEGRAQDKSIPEWVPIKDLNLTFHTMPNVTEVIESARRFLERANS